MIARAYNCGLLCCGTIRAEVRGTEDLCNLGDRQGGATVSHRFIKHNLTGGVGRAENFPDCLVSYQHSVTWGDQSCCRRRGRDTVTLVFRVTMLEPLTIVEEAAFSVMSIGSRTRFTAILRSASVTCNPTWPPWRAQVSSFD